MNPAADLAFFQNLYDGVSLYVVAEPTPSESPTSMSPALLPAELPTSSAPAPVTAQARPVPVPPVAAAPIVTANTAAASQSAASPGTPVAPVAAVKLPSLANLQSEQAPPAAAGSAREPIVPVLAELPAAAAAPAGRVQPTPTQSPVAHIPFSTLGSNPNGLIILVRLPETEFRKLPRNVFLNNILKAIRLIVEDVVLVNVEHPTYPVALCTLRQTLGARQFLAFGKNLLDVAVYTTQPYEPVLLFGDTAFLGAGEISMLEYDAGRKKQLWQAMQRMFM
ncbi:hypothetical protein HMJ29_17910 [Hymenobacter taeanensis]|uniref:Uncharacterized protein n=1 Tax=Hymenobacter taeanensis TaxID=2735321 RepID=A0A6M6BJF9_9BACT|nr:MULTISPECIES: hypothetical protein [Hymenobacter]QJX48691.1 hypothetical protein HMJ29_17910 [Hymenobacter taeanensis]UOQ81809.1 hypothetical protein MUN83_03180 [Hymenobacter sp. 5414T-23]